ncbi:MULTISPECIES: SAM-dependent methyltransferase [Streptosporangium]|uniref:SAM-dependent methyltransferase n=1 Tax=Streptosporangium brasiliense TaxID=47480 RepID=A0ABT9QZR9_9ACTN|nr:SAM-dependent methyltransferase [Streptosporangium brasiliense]MDP9862466.1 SAM-dependent methyltransferase [Streptosporangium brasiliense]
MPSKGDSANTRDVTALVGADTPNIARMYDYWLGGKDNFAADRESAEEIVKISEGRVLRGVRLNRAFLGRAVRAAAEAGVRQFLDLGSGLPTRENVHEVAGPGARVVYVDYDPVVASHAHAILARSDGVGFVQADLRRPAEILGHPTVREIVDFDEPLALLFVSVLHFVGDADGPHRVVADFRDAAAPGSHLILSHLSKDGFPQKMAATEQVYQGASARLGARTREEILAFFDGFELSEPGLVGPTEWRPGAGGAGPERFAGLVGMGVRR